MARLHGSLLAAGCALVLNVAQAANPLSIGTKTLHLDTQRSDPAFFDASGREVIFHGWNVSGSVKLASRGFKPFDNTADAERAFGLMRQYTGANLVRFTLGWEGTHPQVDTLDTAYLDAIAEQVKAAIAEGMFVFLDYHTDLYSRHLFGPTDLHTGNGAPRWIIEGGDYPQAGCGVLCFSWSMNTILNGRVRAGYRNFWDNAPVYTLAGERRVQDEFLWQLRESLLYLKDKFSADEWHFILGVQPFNEPTYGRGHVDRADEFDNDKLWPFYRKVRAVMDETGWQQQWVYAEPLVFWHTNAGFFTPPTGGHYLRDIPESGYVFAPHFYDAARMGVSNFNRVENADYFPDIDYVRDETRFLQMPVVIGEFGMWLHDQNGGAKDYARIVNATYQAMEASDVERAGKAGRLDRRLDFYTLTVSGTQWHWDIYKDQHHELRNGNPALVMQKGDGWNDEDFSAIKGDQLTVGADIVSRIYPRAVQGRLVNFFYHPLAKDGAGKVMDWAAIDTHGQRLFANVPFALVTWQGTHSDLPTEIFIPPQFAAQDIRVITRQGVWQAGDVSSSIALLEDRGAGGGHVLQVSADSAAEADLHFALIVLGAQDIPAQLSGWLAADIDALRHPVFLTGRMANPNYVEDPQQDYAVEVQAKTLQFLVLRQVTLNWQSDAPVTVFRNGKRVMEGAASGKQAFFSLVGRGDQFRICQQTQADACSRVLTFH
jgi:hypothetical protein